MKKSMLGTASRAPLVLALVLGLSGYLLGAGERDLSKSPLGSERASVANAKKAGEKHIRQCIPFPRMMDKVYI
jgi:hypothetical protein